MSIKSVDIRIAIAALRYHNRVAVTGQNSKDYLSSGLELDTLKSISVLTELYKRMTEKNRKDYIGDKI